MDPKYIVAELKSQIETIINVLSHQGEMGRNLELVVKDLLRKYVPLRFGIDSGFMRVLSDPDWHCPQLDLIFSHQHDGYPLAVFPGTKVFPREAVIGYMDVTKRMTLCKLMSDFKKARDIQEKTMKIFQIPSNIATLMQGPIKRTNPAVAKARRLAYLPKKQGRLTSIKQMEQRIGRREISGGDLPPRFFSFAFTSEWSNVETICKNLALAGSKYEPHLHGMLVLDKGLFVHTPSAIKQEKYRLLYLDDIPSAFMLFIHTLIDSLITSDSIPSHGVIPLDKYNFVQRDYKLYNPPFNVIEHLVP